MSEGLLIGGFYSLKSAAEVIGTLYARVDGATGQVVAHHKQKFEARFLAQYLSTRQIEKGRELGDYYLDDLVLRSDGGVLLLAEQFYRTTQTSRDIYGYWYSRDLLHYEDISIFSLSAGGEVEWTATIPKRQAAEERKEISYLPLVGESSLFLFYKTRLKGFGTNVYVSEVSYEGVVRAPRAFFERFRASDVFFRIFCEQIGNREAILTYFQNGSRSFTLAKVAF